MLYFDMDGVLFEYDAKGYVVNEDGDVPYNTIGLHYFRNRELDPVACEIFDRMLELYGDDVAIITTVSSNCYIRKEQVIDKIESIYDRFPTFDIGANFIAVSTDKRDFIQKIRGMSLNRRDILIDDWNPNLRKWAMAGGTAIKYCNGINSYSSWNGEKIRHQDFVIDTVTKLNSIIAKG